MVDYSKWNNIKVSDDEYESSDEKKTNGKPTAGTIESELQKERKIYEIRLASHNRKLAEIEAKKKLGTDVTRLMEDWNKEERKLAKAKSDLFKKHRPAKAATSSSPTTKDTLPPPPPTKQINEMSTDEKQVVAAFIEKYQKILLDYGRQQGHDDTKSFLKNNPAIVTDETTHFFGFWCIELALKGKLDMLDIVSRHAITLQCLLEFARQVKLDAVTCIDPFFDKFNEVSTKEEYQQIFDDQLAKFRSRVKKQALAQLLTLPEEDQRNIVWSSLPDLLKQSIDDEDEDLFNDALKEESKDDAKYHVSRCTAARLWTPKNTTG